MGCNLQFDNQLGRWDTHNSQLCNKEQDLVGGFFHVSIPWVSLLGWACKVCTWQNLLFQPPVCHYKQGTFLKCLRLQGEHYKMHWPQNWQVRQILLSCWTRNQVLLAHPWRKQQIMQNWYGPNAICTICRQLSGSQCVLCKRRGFSWMWNQLECHTSAVGIDLSGEV
jgi:hypothetical protein